MTNTIVTIVLILGFIWTVWMTWKEYRYDRHRRKHSEYLEWKQQDNLRWYIRVRTDDNIDDAHRELIDDWKEMDV